jgi:DNA-binding response OmpR family regulator
MYDGFHPKRILVADDDDLLVELLRFKLEQRGHEVSVATDGAAALRMAEQHRPDVLVLDLMMPAMDGFELLRRFKEHRELRNIPAIVLSGRRQEQDIVRALSLGAQDYLIKPFIPSELLLRIENQFVRRAA